MNVQPAAGDRAAAPSHVSGGTDPRAPAGTLGSTRPRRCPSGGRALALRRFFITAERGDAAGVAPISRRGARPETPHDAVQNFLEEAPWPTSRVVAQVRRARFWPVRSAPSRRDPVALPPACARHTPASASVATAEPRLFDLRLREAVLAGQHAAAADIDGGGRVPGRPRPAPVFCTRPWSRASAEGQRRACMGCEWRAHRFHLRVPRAAEGRARRASGVPRVRGAWRTAPSRSGRPRAVRGRPRRRIKKTVRLNGPVPCLAYNPSCCFRRKTRWTSRRSCGGWRGRRGETDGRAAPAPSTHRPAAADAAVEAPAAPRGESGER